MQTWRLIPDNYLDWRPDQEAYSFGEMIRHVWVGDYEYLHILKTGGLDPEEDIYQNVPITSVEQEIEYSHPHRQQLLDWIRNLPPEQLIEKSVARPAKGYQRPLGDMLMRIAYHDSVHIGYFKQYLRMVQLEQPNMALAYNEEW
ncbi:DinB superfamily protein [Marininema halotolerans]|uniref:DinB superfamily protein n=2 Tax=Marininema halotolerans TaxID=1155944 RepID=A0A1I6RJU2_9BACL|nr:DinB superfamily protein [Marininema halotolerans]